LSLASESAPTDVLADLQYEFDQTTKIAYMQHVQAYGMPGGTGAGYLLFLKFLEAAMAQGMTQVSIGLGVDRASSTRNLESARAERDQNKITEANAQLAAVSHSLQPVREVYARCLVKARAKWLQKTAPSASSSKCFLTTACVVWRGLPYDCEELLVLRRFRDSYVCAIPGGPELIAHYSAVAPALVEAIAARSDSALFYERIYEAVRTAVGAIQSGAPAIAFDLYSRLVLDLDRELAADQELMDPIPGCAS
jgi:hypothetical protein